MAHGTVLSEHVCDYQQTDDWFIVSSKMNAPHLVGRLPGCSSKGKPNQLRGLDCMLFSLCLVFIKL